MHIYISQHALEEGMNAIVEEIVSFSYMMLREGYDAESIIQFLENAEDEDFDFIYEQADSEMLSESAIDEMSDEEVLLYEEHIGLIIENAFLRGMLRRMSPAALKKFVKNNAAAKRLAERLGLLKKGPSPKPIPKTPTPKTPPKSNRTPTQQSATKTTPKPTPKPTPKSKPIPKKVPKISKGKLAGTALVAAGLGLGLNQAGLFPGAQDPVAGNDRPSTDSSSSSTTDSSSSTTDSSSKDKFKTKGRPWWIALNRKVLTQPSTFKSDVALKRFRNPSGTIRSHYEYLVDYIIAEGHADTVEEATYVMQEMGEEVAVEILSEVI